VIQSEVSAIRWEPFREPLRVTLARTVTIAAVAGRIVAIWAGGLSRWPVLTLLMLWPALGGHWVDVLFRNAIAPRLSASRGVQRLARLAVWFGGGILLAMGMQLTASLILQRGGMTWLTWARAGALFVAIELVAHAGLHRRGRPNFYDGRG
jgi:hypothetical protein